jgi:O-antigen ligase
VRSVVLVLLFLDTLMTGSLGALSGLALGIAAALVVGVASKRGPAPAVALLLAIAMGVSSGVLIAERYQIMTAAHKSHNSLLKNSLGREAQSSGERRNLTIETTELAGSTPLFGRGPSSTESVLRAEQAPYVKQAHDDWIAAYIERGVLGVLALLLLVAAIAHYAWRAMRARAPDGAAERGLPAPQYLIGGLALVLVFSFTHEVLHDRVAWTLFGLLAGIQLVTQVQLPNLRRG